MDRLQNHIELTIDHPPDNKFFLEEAHRALMEQGKIIRRQAGLLRSKDSVINDKDNALEECWKKIEDMEIIIHEKNASISNIKRNLRAKK